MRLSLNGIFKDRMVFQWGADIRVFGSSSTECLVCVQLLKDGKKVSESQVLTDADLKFTATLPPVDMPGGPYQFKIQSRVKSQSKWTSEQIINDCYAGEVWIAAGSSNMEYPLARSAYAKYTVESVPATDIRFYNVPAAGFMDEAQRAAEEASEWIDIDGETCMDMSAVSFYFAREIEARIDCKIGIIGCFMARTSISCWLSEECLMSTRDGRKMKKSFDVHAESLTDEEFDIMKVEYESDVEMYEARLKAILNEDPYITYGAAREKIGDSPSNLPVGYKAERHPGAVFECMVKRIIPFTVRGVIFYQGEADCDERAPLYGQVFASMIEEWREEFLDLDLPFIFCQLPMYISKERRFMDYDDFAWAKLREQQQTVANEVHDTYMAVLADCGEFDNVHPADKKTPGKRIAAMALKFVYGFRDVPALAPYIIDARRGDGVEISFGGDFLLLNLTTGFDSDDTGFEVAGEDGEFHKAAATVDFDGRTVLLNCPQVEFPVKVRYGYFSYGATPLYADNGLAATPFSVSVEKTLGGM